MPRPLQRRDMLRLTITSALSTSATTALSLGAPNASAPHARWDRLLRATVSPAGWVDYRRLATDYAGELGTYLKELGTLFGSTRADTMAFWINAYNAVCLRTLLDHELPDEVPHAKIFGTNIFTEERYVVAGKRRSLDDIEHRILRRQYRDPRIHAAVVCGASSCPRLRPEAYVGARLGAQLDEECRSFIGRERDLSGKRKNYLDRERKVYFASKIFDWYEDDFGGDAPRILQFIARHASPGDRAFLERHDVELDFLPYDWSLNRQR